MTRPRRTDSAVPWLPGVILTSLFWLGWLYLVMPLLSLVLWFFGVNLFIDEVLAYGGYQALMGDLYVYGQAILVLWLGMLAWIYWNSRRYGQHETRTHQPQPVTCVELATHAGLSPNQLRKIQRGRAVTVSFDDEYRPRVVPRSSSRHK